MSRPSTPESLLESPQVCVLATVNPGGSPHAMPMWYLYEDGKIWFTTQAHAQKAKNIERTGQAAVTLDIRDRPYYGVMVKGTAEVGEALARETLIRLIERYLSPTQARNYAESLITRGSNASIIVTPTKFVEFSS
ncbi:MAG: PPOX class F420-dependent oxidoreductase [Gammaproteobacteria bacterium]